MYLTQELIDPFQFQKGSENFVSGAHVIFFGIVRNHSEGRNPMIPARSREPEAPVSAGQRVLFLEYEAFPEMAESLLEDLIKQAYSQWPVEEIKLLHRIGRVELGQIAVAIEVLSAHRDEAYQASRFLIEEIKHKVPIWKKEFFEDGTSAWRSCHSHHSFEKEKQKK